MRSPHTSLALVLNILILVLVLFPEGGSVDDA